MADLPNVWVCSWWVMLIRADHIVGLCAVDDRDDLLSEGMFAMSATSRTRSPWWLAAEVKSGEGEDGKHRVRLRRCSASQLIPAISGLAKALAMASRQNEAPLYVYPLLGAQPEERQWEVATELPSAWPGT